MNDYIYGTAVSVGCAVDIFFEGCQIYVSFGEEDKKLSFFLFFVYTYIFKCKFPLCFRICFDSDFVCLDGSCIYDELRCNGQKDCADGSDELKCGTNSITHNTYMYLKFSK